MKCFASKRRRSSSTAHYCALPDGHQGRHKCNVRRCYFTWRNKLPHAKRIVMTTKKKIAGGIRVETEKNGHIEFGVMKLPCRKSYALYVRRGGSPMDIAAYFTSDETAEKFQRCLDFIVTATGGEGK